MFRANFVNLLELKAAASILIHNKFEETNDSDSESEEESEVEAKNTKEDKAIPNMQIQGKYNIQKLAKNKLKR